MPPKSRPEEQPRSTSAMPPINRLGFQHSEDTPHAHKRLHDLNGFHFDVAPCTNFFSKDAEIKFCKTFGSLNPKFTPERFDSLRERVQVAKNKDKHDMMMAFQTIYTEFLSRAFTNAKNVDYAEFERMLYPSYVNPNAVARRTLKLPKRNLWYKQSPFSLLENISRMPLENCNEDKEMTMSFEEFHSLFWNYYHPFNINAFLCFSLAQSMIYTQELVSELAEYIAGRHSLLDTADKKSPILFLGPSTGKLGGLLNKTGIIPTKIIHTNTKPNVNPYALSIPDHKQEAFRPHPIQKMSDVDALKKYEPSIVLMSDMPAQKDTSYCVRQQGSVREYTYIGAPDGYSEGMGWDTWGNFRYKPKDSGDAPAFIADGWIKFIVPHVGRWVIHKNDSGLQMNNGAVQTFCRKAVYPKWSERVLNLKYLKRLRPFF